MPIPWIEERFNRGLLASTHLPSSFLVSGDPERDLKKNFTGFRKNGSKDASERFQGGTNDN